MQIRKPAEIILAACLFLAVTCGHLSAQSQYRVRWVDDGDTVVLNDGRRVRYIGINAPEIGHDDRKAEPYGYSAKQFNAKLVFEKLVGLEFDQEHRDHYGRVLAYVFLEDGSFVNQEMLERGYAHVLYRLPNVKYHDRLLQAQRRAMKAAVGIWRNWQEIDQAYPANRKSKRFHRPACPYGKKTSAGNRVTFKTSWEAFWQGYAPGRNCFGK